MVFGLSLVVENGACSRVAAYRLLLAVASG